MFRKTLIPVVCLCAALALGLVGCGGSSSSSNASAASSAASSEASADASSSAAPKEFPAEYTNDNGGITLAAVLNLNGPDLVTLLEQQGYEFKDKSNYWENPANENRFEVRLTTAKDIKDGITMDEYLAATEPGSLAKDYVYILSHDYDLSEISEEMYASIRESMLPGFEVQELKYLAFGGECWAIVTNSNGDRYLLEIGAYDEHTAQVTLESDEYLAADGMGSIDELYY